MRRSKISEGKYEFQWGEQHSMVSAEYWADSYGPYVLGNPKFIDYMIISGNKYLDTYASQGMLNEWRTFSKTLLDKNRRKELLKSSMKMRINYWNLYKRFLKMRLTKISNYELLDLLREYINVLKNVGKNFVVSQPEGFCALTKKLQRELRNNESEHLMSILITATVPNIIFKEQFDLNKITHKGKINKKTLYLHALKHAWLFFNSYDIENNIKFLRMRLDEKFDYQHKLLEMKQLRRKQEIIFKRLRNEKIREFCFFLQKISIERLELKNCWAGAEFRFLALFQEIAKRIQIPFDSMMAIYNLKDYQRALLNQKFVPKSKFKLRIKNFIFWKHRSKLELIEDSKSVQFIVKNLKEGVKKIKLEQIKGMSANPGKVMGKCSLVKSVDINQVLRDARTFNKGNILVAWMTQPNMVSIVSKAAAIIADEGGITSHAAVMAREFNIPCIVGTKIATKVFKDNDWVEVDANRGTVRKITESDYQEWLRSSRAKKGLKRE